MKTIYAAVILATMSVTIAFAQWQPSGPIKLLIAFGPGGGSDTMARMISDELKSEYGWNVIPENVVGSGGAVMARALKDASADGLTLGISGTSTYSYNTLAIRDAGYSEDEFDFIATIAGTQMAVVAKAERGWKNMSDVIAAMKSGEEISFGTPTQQLTDGARYIGNVNGVEFNIVSGFKGAKGVLNAITADDIDIGWVTGIQKKGIESGDLVNLLNAEDQSLSISPDAQTLKEVGVDFFLGGTAVIASPAGLSDDAREAITEAIASVVQKPGTKLQEFITKVYYPKLKTGDDALAFIKQELIDNDKLLKATAN